jgi:putative ABC transport system ATP-binding protein
MALLSLDSLTKVYSMGHQELRALNAVSLEIPRGSYVAITGTSGSGKSTMLNILGCLDKPSSGVYVLNNTDVGTLSEDRLAEIRNHEIGFIFQSFNLLPRASALENVMQPLVYRGCSMKERRRLAEAALARVGLGNRIDHLPNQLSGGQRQRVAIARALVTEPSILLADEPTGNLDSQTTKEVMSLFDELYAQGQTIIIVTHEAEIAAHCERVIRLEDGYIASDKNNNRLRPSYDI